MRTNMGSARPVKVKRHTVARPKANGHTPVGNYNARVKGCVASLFLTATLTGIIPALMCNAIIGACETWGYWLIVPIFGIPAAVAWRVITR